MPLFRDPWRILVVTLALGIFACGDDGEGEGVEGDSSGTLQLGVTACSNHSRGVNDSEGVWAAQYDGKYDPPARLGVFLQEDLGFAHLRLYGCVLRPSPDDVPGPEIRTFDFEFTLPLGRQEDVVLTPGVSAFSGRVYALYSVNDPTSSDQDVYTISQRSTGTATIAEFDPFESHIEGTLDVMSTPFARIEDDDEPINVKVDFALDW